MEFQNIELTHKNNPTIQGLVTIIIPVYNTAKYLKEALDSVCAQTYRELEIICINDGSTDNSLEILESYAAKDERIKIISQENSGVSWVRGVGLNNAHGELIGFLDSDDRLYDENVIASVYKEFQNLDAEMIIFSFYNQFKGAVLQKAELPMQNGVFNWRNYKYLFNHNFHTVMWCKFYRKSFLDRYSDWNFQKHLKCEDWYIHYQFLVRAKKIGKSDIPIIVYRRDVPNSEMTKLFSTDRHVYSTETQMLSLNNFITQENVIKYFSLEYAQMLILDTAFDLFNAREFPAIVKAMQNIYSNLDDRIKKILKSREVKKQITEFSPNRDQINYYNGIRRLSYEDAIAYQIRYRQRKFEKSYKTLHELKKQLVSAEETVISLLKEIERCKEAIKSCNKEKEQLEKKK